MSDELKAELAKIKRQLKVSVNHLVKERRWRNEVQGRLAEMQVLTAAQKAAAVDYNELRHCWEATRKGLDAARWEIQRMRDTDPVLRENQNLRHQVECYQRDVKSLRESLAAKVTTENKALHASVAEVNKQIAQLGQTLKEQEQRIVEVSTTHDEELLKEIERLQEELAGRGPTGLRGDPG